MDRWAPRLLPAVAVILAGGLVALALATVDDGGPSAASPPTLPNGEPAPDVATTTPPDDDGPWEPLPEPTDGDASSGSTATTAPAPVYAPVAPGSAGVVVTPTGVLAPVTIDLGNGSYEVQTPCDSRAVVTGTPLAGAHIVLDPGHGGDEPGAVGPNGLVEKELNLAVAQRAAEALRAAGATVVLTRDSDLRLTLANRAAIALGLRPVAFVSIHHNAAADGPSPIPGTEVYFQVASPDSQRLAGLLVEEIRAGLAPFGGPWESDATNGGKARVRGDTGEDFYGVLRRTAGLTSVLTEAGYLSNPAEAELFARPEVQQAEADAIARALTRFIDGGAPEASAFSPAPPATGGAGGSGGGPDGCVDPPLG